MARAEEGVRWKAENLVPDFLFEEVRRLVGRGHGAGKKCVADDGDVWRVFGPIADDIRDPIFGVAGCIPIGDPQAAKGDAIVGAISVLWRGSFGVGVDAKLRESFAQRPDGRHVIVVSVREKEVFEGNRFLVDEFQNWRRIPACVEQGPIARDFVPHEKAVHGEAFARGGDDAKFTPESKIARGGQPTCSDAREFFRMQADDGRDFRDVNGRIALAGAFQLFQQGRGEVRGPGHGFEAYAGSLTCLRNDVAQRIDQCHREELNGFSLRVANRIVPQREWQAFRATLRHWPSLVPER